MSNDDFDFDFGDLDDMDGDIDSGGFGPKAINTKSNRSPVQQSAKMATAGLKAGIGAVGPHITRELSKGFPTVDSHVNEVFTVATDVERMRQEFMKDLEPTIAQGKRLASKLAPRLKPYLPDAIYNKVDNMVKKFKEEDPGAQQISKQQMESSAIGESLSNIFGQQEEIQEERRKVDKKEEQLEKQIDRSLESSRHKDIVSVLEELRKNSNDQAKFVKTIYTGYLKKSLELQYKHLFVAQDMLELAKLQSKMLENKLEEIRQNTALPDVQKRTKLESFKDKILQEKFGNKLYGWGGTVTKNIKEMFFDPLTQGHEDAKDMMGQLEMAGDMLDMMDDFGGPSQTPGEQIAGMIGAQLTKFGLSTGMGKYLKKLDPLRKKIEKKAKNLKLEAALNTRDKAYESDDMGFMGTMWQILNPKMRRGAGELKNNLASNPDEPAIFDVSVKQSITEIIPAWFGKIHQELVGIRTGSMQQEQVYDIRRRDFVSVGKLREDALNDMFGNKDDRTRRVGQGIATLRAEAKDGGKISKKLDQYNDQLTKFLGNCVVYQQHMTVERVKQIQEVAKNGKLDTQYKKYMFKGITGTDPKTPDGSPPSEAQITATILSGILVKNGQIDNDSIQNVNNWILSEITNNESYLEKMHVLQQFGYTRHFNDLMKDGVTSSGTRQFDEEAIRNRHYGNVDADKLKDQIEMNAKYMRADTKEEAQGMLEFIEFAKKVGFEKALPYIDKFLGSGADARKANLKTSIRGVGTRDFTTMKFDESYNPELGEVNAKLNRIIPSAQSSTVKDEIVKVLVTNDVLSVAIKNLQDMGRVPKQGKGSNTGSNSDIVSIVKEFKKAFDEYASKQNTTTDKLISLTERMSESITSYLPSLGDVKSYMTDMANNIKNINLGMVHPGLMGQIYQGGKNLVNGAYDKVIKAGKLYKDFIFGSKTKNEDGSETESKGLLGYLTGAVSGTAGFARKGLFGHTTKDKDGNETKYRGLLELLGAGAGWGADRAGKLVGNGVKGTKGILQSANDAFYGKLGFADIYRKDKMVKGEPLLTKKQQEDDAVFEDGKKLKSSYEIDRPVFDSKGNTLISAADIEAGLITVDGTEVTTVGKTIGSSIGGALGSIWKGAKNLGGMAAKGLGRAGGIYASMLELGLAGAKGAGKFGMGLMNKMFGIDGSGIGGGKQLKKHVGDKLDKIFDLLKKTIGKDIVEDDMDGDGVRDNSWQDQDKKKDEKSLRNKIKDKFNEKKLAMAAAMGGGEDGEGGGFLTNMASMMGASWLGNKLKNSKIWKGIKGAPKGAWNLVKGGAKGIFGTALGGIGGLLGMNLGGAGAGAGLGRAGGTLIKELGTGLGRGILSVFTRGLPSVLSTAARFVPGAGRLAAGATALYAGIKGAEVGGKAAAGLNAASAFTNATIGATAATTTAAEGATKATGILTKLISFLPGSWQKVIMNSSLTKFITKIFQKASKSVIGKILGRLTPWATPVFGAMAAWAGLKAFSNTPEIIGVAEEKVTFIDKVLTGGCAALWDFLAMDLWGPTVGISSIGAMAKTCGAGSSSNEEKVAGSSGDKNTPSFEDGVTTKKDEKKISEFENEQKANMQDKDSWLSKASKPKSTLNKIATWGVLKYITYPILNPKTSARWLYSFFATEDWNKEWQIVRAKAYGIEPDKSYSFATSGLKAMKRLEEDIWKCLEKEETLSDDMIVKHADNFGLADKATHIKFFTTWLYQRFTPVFGVFMQMLKAQGLAIDDYDYKIDRDKAPEFIKKFDDSVKARVGALSNLKPDMQSYLAFEKAQQEVATDGKISQGSKVEASAIDRKRAELVHGDKQGTRDSVNARDTEAVARMNGKSYDEQIKVPDPGKAQVSTGNSNNPNATTVVANGYGRTSMAAGLEPGSRTTTGSTVPGLRTGTGLRFDDIPQPEGGGFKGMVKMFCIVSAMVGIDVGLLALMAGVESRFVANAKSSTSSAKGIFQFVSKTWNGMIAKYARMFGVPADTDANDPRANTLMSALYLRENYSLLQKKLGRTPTDLDLYCAHFMGPGGCINFLLANDDVTVASIFKRDVLEANRSIFYEGKRIRTVGEVKAELNKRLNAFRTEANSARSMMGMVNNQQTRSIGSEDTSIAASTFGLAKDINNGTMNAARRNSGPMSMGQALENAKKYNSETGALSSSNSSGDGSVQDLNTRGNVNVKDLNPSMLQNLVNMNSEYEQMNGGKGFVINSAYRSVEDQAKIYEEKGPGLAAKPGSSMHNYGLAVDISASNGDADKLASTGLLDKYGFTRPLLNSKTPEPWHVEPAGIDRAAIRQQGMAMASSHGSVKDAPVGVEEESGANAEPINTQYGGAPSLATAQPGKSPAASSLYDSKKTSTGTNMTSPYQAIVDISDKLDKVIDAIIGISTSDTLQAIKNNTQTMGEQLVAFVGKASSPSSSNSYDTASTNTNNIQHKITEKNPVTAYAARSSGRGVADVSRKSLSYSGA